MSWEENPKFAQDTATIANGTATSGVIDLEGRTLCGVLLPAALTGTTFTFSTSATSDGTFVNITNGAGSDYGVTVAASKYVPVDYTKFIGVRFLKIISGSSEAGERAITVVSRKLF